MGKHEVELAANKISLGEYLRMTKPAVWDAIVITGVIGFLIGSMKADSLSFLRLAIAVVALSAGTAGCESITNVIDLPVDRVMRRTENRSLPQGRIAARSALYLGIILISVSLVLSLELGYVFLALMAAGAVDNVVVYSYWLKRRTSQNIIWGAVSGAIPAAFGLLAADQSATILAVLIFMFVFFWTPPHIWSLSVEYKEDYARAGVPMLPVVANEHSWKLATGAFSAAMITVSLFFAWQSSPSILPLTVSSLLGLYCAFQVYSFIGMPEKYAHRLFVFLNAYLVAALIVPFFSLIG